MERRSRAWPKASVIAALAHVVRPSTTHTPGRPIRVLASVTVISRTITVTGTVGVGVGAGVAVDTPGPEPPPVPAPVPPPKPPPEPPVPAPPAPGAGSLGALIGSSRSGVGPGGGVAGRVTTGT